MTEAAPTGHEIEAAATVTVDVVLVHQDADGGLHALLVERSQPIRGQRALPGGFAAAVEHPDDAARRELGEEAGIPAPDTLELLAAHGHPGEHPMDEVVKLVYGAVMPTMPEPTGGDDAISDRWVQIEAGGVRLFDFATLAFDHDTLLAKALNRLRTQLTGSAKEAAFSDWQKYHEATVITRVYGHWPIQDQLSYAGLGLVNEAGEVAGELKKLLRDDEGALGDKRRARIIDEAGDVLWYLARVLESAGASLEDAAAVNIAKAERRMANGTLKGSGQR